MKKLICIILSLLTLSLFCSCSLSNVPEQEHPPHDGTHLKELTVYSFQAGKADAHLIYTEDFAVLIDCGEKGFGKEIVSYMEDNGIKKLDYLIITHFDKDHVGGAAKVIRSVQIDNVLQSNSPKESVEYTSYLEELQNAGIQPQTVRSDLSFTLGDAAFTVDPPMLDFYEEDSSNNSSLVTWVTYGNYSMLFMGDCEDMRLREFMNANTLTCDYLKVPYHGHYQKELRAFINEVSPRFAVITSSDAEPEDEETLSYLKDVGAKTFLTRQAPVVAFTDGISFDVTYAARG